MANNKIDTSKLQEVTPASQFTAVKEVWADIKAARERGLTLRAIFESLKDGGLDVSYATFTRMVKKMQHPDAEGNAPSSVRWPQTSTSQGEASASPADDPLVSSHDANSADKADVIVSTAGAALDDARKNIGKKDYSKIAKQKRIP